MLRISAKQIEQPTLPSAINSGDKPWLSARIHADQLLSAAASSPSGSSLLATAMRSGNLRIWDFANLQEPCGVEFNFKKTTFSSVTFGSENLVAASTMQGYLILLSSTGPSSWSPIHHDLPELQSYPVKVAPNTIAVALKTGGVQVFRLEEGQIKAEALNMQGLRAIQLDSPCNGTLLVKTDSNSIMVWKDLRASTSPTIVRLNHPLMASHIRGLGPSSFVEAPSWGIPTLYESQDGAEFLPARLPLDENVYSPAIRLTEDSFIMRGPEQSVWVLERCHGKWSGERLLATDTISQIAPIGEKAFVVGGNHGRLDYFFRNSPQAPWSSRPLQSHESRVTAVVRSDNLGLLTIGEEGVVKIWGQLGS